MAERFFQRFARRLLELRLRLAAGRGIATHWKSEQRHEHHHRGKPDEAVRPAIGGNQALADRREQEHAG